MAGSKKWFVYTTDEGTKFAILADESNVKSVANNADDYATADGTFAVPRNVTPRAAYYGNASRIIKVPILTDTVYADLPTGQATITDPIAGTGTLNFIRKTPEKIRFPRVSDTGLNDGTD